MADRPTERGGSRPTYVPGNDDTAVRPATARVQQRPRPSGSPKPSSTEPTGKTAKRPTQPRRPATPRKAPSGAARKAPADAEPRRTSVVAPAAPGKTRRARLRLTRVDPWSVMKTAFLLSIALGVVTIVSVFMVWSVLTAAGVWDSINSTVQDVVGGQDAGSFDVEDYVGTNRVLGFTMVIAAVDVMLLTAMATLGAFLYNMAAQLLGGIEVTLSEDN